MPTIQGKLRSGLGVPLQTAVEFETRSAPTLGADYVVSKTRKSISTDADGAFQITLEPGDWYARWTNGPLTTQVAIAVPESDLTYQFHTLITDALVYTFAVSPQYVLQAPLHGSFRVKDGKHLQIWNATTSKWHSLVASGPEGAAYIGLGPGES